MWPWHKYADPNDFMPSDKFKNWPGIMGDFGMFRGKLWQDRNEPLPKGIQTGMTCQVSSLAPVLFLEATWRGVERRPWWFSPVGF